VLPKRTILVIEGSSSLLEQLERLLEMAGYHTYTARRALEALDIARKTEIDMILTSIDLPDLSGRELATTLRADVRFRKTPIVALIDHDIPEQREMNIAAGINGFIQRPINVDALPSYIEFYMSGGQDAPEDDSRLEAARELYVQDVVSRLEGRIRELERKNTDLERLDHMKDSFIQLTSHELRTPLTLVSGYLRLLEDYPGVRNLMSVDGEFQTLFGGLSESLDRMQGVIEEILITSRIMTSKIELNLTNVQPAAIMQRVLNEFGFALIDRELTIQFNPMEWPERIHADADLLHITLANLVSNAIKYTPNQGHIYITARHNNQVLMFSIRDTGIGIDQTHQRKIFERIHIGGDVEMHGTSKTAFGGGGLGLGLAICKGIIEAHGGKIKVESAGHDRERCPGSEFTVLLPISVSDKRGTAILKRLAART
jgi:signal transduction histidine kinase